MIDTGYGWLRVTAIIGTTRACMRGIRSYVSPSVTVSRHEHSVTVGDSRAAAVLLVPMPPLNCGGGTGGGTVSFSLPKNQGKKASASSLTATHVETKNGTDSTNHEKNKAILPVGLIGLRCSISLFLGAHGYRKVNAHG